MPEASSTEGSTSSDRSYMKKRKQDIELDSEHESLHESESSGAIYPFKSKKKKSSWPGMTLVLLFILIAAFFAFRGENEPGTSEIDTIDIQPLPSEESLVVKKEEPMKMSELSEENERTTRREDITISSGFGSFDVVKFLPSQPDPSKSMIAIHGANSMKDIREEWFRVSEKLSNEGYTVYCPNFHSNSNLKPGSSNESGDEAYSIAIKELMDAEGLETIVLGGKSWGGGKAAHVARKHPGRIKKLVLCAPAMEKGDTITIPTLLAYCEDDGIGRRAKRTLQECVDDDLLEIFTVESGGHRIVEELDEKIIEFVTSD